MEEKHLTQENSFDPAPGGGAGSVNYGGDYGTPGGGNTTQNPDHFSSSEKGVNHFGNETGSLARLPDRPDRVSSSGGTISPGAAMDKAQSEKPLNPEDSYGPDVDKLFQKKKTPSPDEIMSALQYELSQMVKKDKTIAKRTVLKNLQQDPQYYSKLGMLNIDDKKMKVDEGEATTFSKTKNVLDEMIAKRRSQRQIEQLNSPELDEIFKNMWNKRQGRGRVK